MAQWKHGFLPVFNIHGGAQFWWWCFHSDSVQRNSRLNKDHERPSPFKASSFKHFPACFYIITKPHMKNQYPLLRSLSWSLSHQISKLMNPHQRIYPLLTPFLTKLSLYLSVQMTHPEKQLFLQSSDMFQCFGIKTGGSYTYWCLFFKTQSSEIWGCSLQSTRSLNSVQSKTNKKKKERERKNERMNEQFFFINEGNGISTILFYIQSSGPLTCFTERERKVLSR